MTNNKNRIIIGGIGVAIVITVVVVILTQVGNNGVSSDAEPPLLISTSFDTDTVMLDAGDSFDASGIGYEKLITVDPQILVDPQPVFPVPDNHTPWLVFQGAIPSFDELEENNITAYLIGTGGTRSEISEKKTSFAQTQVNLPENENPKYIVFTKDGKDIVSWNLE